MMKSTSTMFKASLRAVILILASAPAAHAMAQAPTLMSSTFYGGAGDQRGTAITVGGGALYISGNVQPENLDASSTAFVLKYALPSGPSPVWARPYGFGTDFFGIAATSEGVYADGGNYTLTTDGVGDKEAKSILAKFAPDGSDGPAPGGALWLALPNFFAYTGVELHLSATTSVESGSTFIYAAGGAQPCSFFAYVIAKYDTSGNLLARATDPGQENAFNSCFFNGINSAGFGVTALNGSVYAAGSRDVNPTIWKHAPNLSVVWRRQDTSLAGQFNAVTAVGNALYAVGFKNTPGVGNSEDYLIEKYDEAGNQLWSQTSGGANTDVLTGVVGIGGRLFAVGHTRSQGSGGADAVVLEIDPATGVTLSTTLFGGAQDDSANGAATDGTDLYVVGESKSFASAAGNVVGQNDVMLLRYAVNSLTDLSPARVFLGLKNSDDYPTAVDVRVEVLKNGVLVTSGLNRCVRGLVRDPARAMEVDTPFDAFASVPVGTGDVLALKVLTRVGTNPDNTRCTGPLATHSNAVGLRLYYDSPSRNSRFDATFAPNPSHDLFLHSDGTPCPAGGGQSAGVTNRFLDASAPANPSAKCKDSGSINFSGGNLFKEIGTWALTLP